MPTPTPSPARHLEKKPAVLFVATVGLAEILDTSNAASIGISSRGARSPHGRAEQAGGGVVNCGRPQ